MDIQGCNVPDLAVVVQWNLPGTFSNFIQRAGRAARGPASGCKGIAVLGNAAGQLVPDALDFGEDKYYNGSNNDSTPPSSASHDDEPEAGFNPSASNSTRANGPSGSTVFNNGLWGDCRPLEEVLHSFPFAGTP